MGHWVTPETSDYWQGYCEIPGCTERPCLSCVKARQQIEARDRLGGRLLQVYYNHHKNWPQSSFIDGIVEVFEEKLRNGDVRPVRIMDYT